MDKFFALLLHDPILLAASIVFLSTVAILIWAIAAWRNNELLGPLPSDEEESPAQDEQDEEEELENSGILEARLHEVSDQLCSISNRLAEMEKKAAEKKSFEPAQQTATPGSPLPANEIERLIKRLESKIEALATEKSQIPSDSITRLESRLEGIHRLLILLTEGEGNPGDK